MEIKKRSGDIAKFDVGKIGAAMRKAFAATGVAVEESRMDELSLSVQQQLEGTPMVTVEQVQDCVEQMQRGAEHFGAETLLAEVQRVTLRTPIKQLDTSEGAILSKTVVLATGATPRMLGLPGERELTGHGVHYCAVCDGRAYRGKTVAVIGGGSSAAGGAVAAHFAGQYLHEQKVDAEQI